MSATKHDGVTIRRAGRVMAYCVLTAGHAAQIRDMYERNMSQAEIAAVFGVQQAAVQRFMRKHGIAARKAAKRDQSGARNHMWKGPSAHYKTLHQRVYRARGKAFGCSRCGIKARATAYHWANLTGRYDDINDYESMCVTCHKRFDISRRKQNVGN